MVNTDYLIINIINEGRLFILSAKLKTKLQLIYYQVDDETLGQFYCNSDKRITLDEAKQILEHEGISFKSVLRVKYRNVELELTDEQIKKSIIRG